MALTDFEWRMRVVTVAGGLLEALGALDDPTRLRVFCALRERERCVRDLTESEHLAQPLVSHHLSRLMRAGLVRARRERTYTMYSVDPVGLTRTAAALDSLLSSDTLAAAARPGGNPQCCA